MPSSTKSTPKPTPRTEGRPKSARPPPSGHTEALRATLREARVKQGMTQKDVAEALTRDYGIEVGDSAIGNWENQIREPSIAEFSAWARVVGMKLIVEVEPADSPRRAVLIHPDRAELAKLANELAGDKIPSATTILERLLSMSAGEVKKLARYLTDEDDD